MHNHGEAAATPHHRKPKSREVSPRFLSPASSTASSSTDCGTHESPNSILSPIKPKPRSSTDSRKPKTLKSSGFLRGLWPSVVPSPSSSTSKKPDTLADFIGNERREELKSKEKIDRNVLSLNRQRSCTEFRRFQNDQKISSKENRNPIFGGSMRYSGKFKISGKSKNSNSLEEDDDNIIPGRLSVDEVAVRKNSFSTKGASDPDSQDSGSEYSDGGPIFDFGASYMAPTVSSRKHRIDVPSRFMQDSLSRSRRWSGGDSLENSNTNDSAMISGSKKKGGVGDWAWSPARTGSPRTQLGESKGKIAVSMKSKPPTSPSRGKGILSNLGELLKGKKSSSRSSTTSPLGPGSAENVHQLRMLHSTLTQWRFGNAKAEVANQNLFKQCEEKSQHVQISLVKLQQSILQKKLQLQKEKLEMKLYFILHSQNNALEAWKNMERQHLSAVSNTTDCLHSVVCKLPLVNGATVEPQMASVALFHASELATKINMMITTFQPTVETTVGVVAELAMVVIQEKQLLEECLDLFKFITALEIEERSLRSSMMQLRVLEQQQQLEILV